MVTSVVALNEPVAGLASGQCRCAGVGFPLSPFKGGCDGVGEPVACGGRLGEVVDGGEVVEQLVGGVPLGDHPRLIVSRARRSSGLDDGHAERLQPTGLELALTATCNSSCLSSRSEVLDRRMASVEQLPDPSDRSKPWMGDEPAYLAWYRHLQEHSDADAPLDQIERHKLISNYAEAVPIPDALAALEELGPLLRGRRRHRLLVEAAARSRCRCACR